MKRPAVFFDRDNTLIVSDGYLGDPDGVVLIAGASEAVARVRRLGYAAVTISNQSGVARGMFSEEDVHHVNSRLDEMLKDHDADAVVDRHEFCPHHPEAVVPRYRQASEFRKPSPGMIYQAARQLSLDLSRSWVIGDAPRDIEAGRAAGCRTILFKDPSLPASAAAHERSEVEPDFVVTTLREAVDVIEKNAGAAEEQVEWSVKEQPIAKPESASEAIGEELASPGISPASGAPGESRGEGLSSGVQEEESETAPSSRHPERSEGSLPVAAEETLRFAQGDGQRPSIPLQTSTRERDMNDKSASRPADSSDTSGNPSEAPRRRSPPAVILAAKAARAAARNSAPHASPQVLREVARSAAREAAMGITRDYSTAVEVAAPQTPVAASEAPAPAEPITESAPIAPDEPALAVQEPAAEPVYVRPVEPASPAYAPTRELPLPAPLVEQPAPVNLQRLEELTEQILLELKRNNEAGSDFSVSKLMSGITMVISLAVLGYAYLNKNDYALLQNLLLLGLLLQSITISLLIMGKQK